MMGEACYAPIDITRRKCVKSVVFQLRIELNAFQFDQMSVVLSIRSWSQNFVLLC